MVENLNRSLCLVKFRWSGIIEQAADLTGSVAMCVCISSAFLNGSMGCKDSALLTNQCASTVVSFVVNTYVPQAKKTITSNWRKFYFGFLTSLLIPLAEAYFERKKFRTINVNVIHVQWNPENTFYGLLYKFDSQQTATDRQCKV